MKVFALSMLTAIVSYVVGGLVGIGIAQVFLHNHQSMESIMTGAFYVGPPLAVLGFVAALVFQLTHRSRRR